MKLHFAIALVLLLAAPVLLALSTRAARKRRERLARLGDLQILGAQAVGLDARPRSERLLVLAFVALVVALAGPRIGSHTELLPRRGLDVVFALDVSRSMLARDVAPDRLARAKAEISAFVDEIGENRVALVAFAGTAFVQCPLTTDTEAMRSFAKGLAPDLVPQGGTALALGLETAARVFESDEAARAEAEGSDTTRAHGRVLVVFTDGEDHEGGAEESAARLRALGVETFVIGLGSTLGEPIPLVDERGSVTDYVKDREGRTVVSRMSPETLALVAEKAGGRFIDGTRAADLGLAAVRDTIARLEKRELEARVKTTYEDRSEWPLALAVLAMCFAFVGGSVRRRRALAPLVIALTFSSAPARAQLFERVEPSIEEGVRAMQAGDGERALELYQRAKTRAADDDAVVEYNVGSVHLQKAARMVEDAEKTPGAPDPEGARQAALDKEVQAAVEAFDRAATLSSKKTLRSDAHLARGNTRALTGDLKGAVEAFRDALVENPENGAARRNLRSALTLLRSEPPPPSDGEQSDEGEQGDDEQQQQQQQQGGGEQKNDERESSEDDEKQDGESQENAGDADDAQDGKESDREEKKGEQGKEGDRTEERDEKKDPREDGSDPSRDPLKDKGDEKNRGQAEEKKGERGDEKPAPAPGDTPPQGKREEEAKGGSARPKDPKDEEARRLLDAMRRSEKPLQPFQMRNTKRRLVSPEKDW